MRSYQYKRKRPSLQDAHSFLKEGSFGTGPEHILEGKARELEIQKISNSLLSVVKDQFPRTQNLEYAILKSHLILEHAITECIRSFANTFVDQSSIKFGFAQKLDIAYLMGFGVNDPILIPTLERLNKIRNQVAHTFSLDRVALDEILRINSDDYEAAIFVSDRKRIQALRYICIYVCGRTAGEIEAAYTLAEYHYAALVGRTKTK